MNRYLGDARALGATSLKEWRIRRRYPSFFLGILFWPLALPAVYVLQANGFWGGDASALHAFARRSGSAEIVGFMYLGGAMYMWLSIILWGPSTSLREEQLRGSLEQVFVTPASRAALLFGPIPAYVVQTLWMFTVVFVALRVAFGIPIDPAMLLRAIAVIVIAIPALFGMGALFATCVLAFREVSGAVQALRATFQLLCGITFPVAVLPDWAYKVALALPPTYIVADLRAVLLGGANLARLVPDFAILIAAAVCTGVLAMAAFKRIENAGRRRGTLGLF